MGANIRWSASTVKVYDLYRLYEEGKTLKEIANLDNTSITNIWRLFKKHNLKIRTRKQAFKLQNRFAENNSNWKGGRHYKGNGYIEVIINGVKWYEHHYIYCIYNNLTSIPLNHEIHHLDGNKENNNINNLKLLNRTDHRKLHKNNKRLN